MKGESVHALKKKKKRAKERLYEGYKGFEKVVGNKEIAEKSGLAKIFNQAEKVESVKVAKKKEKRGREKFEKEFARNGPQVANLMRKVEKNNKKMEKLVLGKEGVAQIAPHGEQRFDAHPNQPKAGLVDIIF